MLRKISWRGVIIGGIVDVGLSNLLAVPFMLMFMIPALRHARPDQYQSISAGMFADHAFILGIQVLGSIASIVGGYVGAWIARHDETLNGALTSWLCFVVAAVALFRHSPQAATVLNSPAYLWALTIGLPAFGGYLRFLRVRAVRATAGQANP